MTKLVQFERQTIISAPTMWCPESDWPKRWHVSAWCAVCPGQGQDKRSAGLERLQHMNSIWRFVDKKQEWTQNRKKNIQQSSDTKPVRDIWSFAKASSEMGSVGGWRWRSHPVPNYKTTGLTISSNRSYEGMSSSLNLSSIFDIFEISIVRKDVHHL